MKWKMRHCVQLLLATCCCLAFVPMTTAATVTEVTEGAEATTAATTEETATSEWETEDYQLEQYPKACYVEKSKVSELLVAMNKTVRFLNRADKYLECPDQMEVIEEDVATLETCSETRIAKIQDELDEITAEIIEMAAGLSNLTEDEYDSLDARKFKLIDNLNALNVIYVLPGPCDSSFAVRYPIRSLVVFVEYNMNIKLQLYRTTRPKRQPTTTTPLPATTASTTPKPTVDDMLNPEKSLTELTRLAHANPSAMSTAVTRIISQRYNRRMSTFDSLLNFLEGLPTAENRIIGVSALYDEMHRYNRDPDAMRLIKVARVVQRLYESTPSHLLEETTSLKLTDLVNDPDLEPLIFWFDRQMSFTKLTEKARLNSTAMSIALPEIISQRYNASDSSFDAFITFVEGLPTSENKIVGFDAIFKEVSCCDRSLNLEQLVKLAQHLKRHNETMAPPVSSSAKTKLDDSLNELLALNFTGTKADCRIINVAYGQNLDALDTGYPQSGYVHSNAEWLWVYPRVKGSQLVFRMRDGDGNNPLYASDTNPNSQSPKHNTKPAERYLLEPLTTPANAEVDWKIVPVSGSSNQFRILSALNDDFMFAHKSATGVNSYRRVLLGRKGFPEYDHIPNADRWTLNCRPGTYSIPSN